MMGFNVGRTADFARLFDQDAALDRGIGDVAGFIGFRILRALFVGVAKLGGSTGGCLAVALTCRKDALFLAAVVIFPGASMILAEVLGAV